MSTHHAAAHGPALDTAAHRTLALAIEQVAAERRLWVQVQSPWDDGEDEHLFLRAWLRPRPLLRRPLRRAGDLENWTVELHVAEGQLLSADGAGRICDLHGIYLPERLRRRGVGTELLDALGAALQQLAVAEVRAAVGSEEGDAAMRAWGFRSAGHSVLGLPQRVLAL